MDHICGENFVSLICSQTVFYCKGWFRPCTFFLFNFLCTTWIARTALHLESYSRSPKMRFVRLRAQTGYRHTGDTASTRKSQGQKTQRALQRLARHTSAAASELKKKQKNTHIVTFKGCRQKGTAAMSQGFALLFQICSTSTASRLSVCDQRVAGQYIFHWAAPSALSAIA